MANAAKRLPHNVPGDFFVDASCIDCDTCRWMAPETFVQRAGQASVHRQPTSPAERLRAEMALLSCPTVSIGTTSRHDLAPARAGLPDPITDDVLHCGYHAESSFGAASYLVLRPEGNVLVDSPRFAGPLVKQLEVLGGVAWMLLTHKDDVADHRRFAEHFGCRRVLHEDDVGPRTDDVEVRLQGEEPIALEAGLRALPVPGHTRGSVCFLHGEILFTGDHLAWSARRGRLTAFRTACWYSWSEQTRSMERLAAHRFSCVLPGHGRRARLAPHVMQDAVAALAREMAGR